MLYRPIAVTTEGDLSNRQVIGESFDKLQRRN